MLTLRYTLSDIDSAVRQFWAYVQQYRVIIFSGDMGAGKTTFISRLCEWLQVEDTVSSPTFALVNEYHFRGAGGRDEVILHLDWYRLNSLDEAINAGMQDCIDQAVKGQVYCFVEWPEKAPALLPASFARVSIESTGVSEREMTISLVG